MTWHPALHAFCATVYITGIISFLGWVETFKANTPDTLIDGVAFLSLFTFSAAVMACLFFYRPLALLINKEPKAALYYLVGTLAYFGATTGIIMTFVLWW
jgi:hypothetical protein